MTYRQVSYGQMIACENPDCETEWFHFSCVGLTAEVRLGLCLLINSLFCYCVAQGSLVLFSV